MFLVHTGRELRGLTNDFALADVRRMTSPNDGVARRRSQKIRGRSSTDLATSLYDHASIQIPSHRVEMGVMDHLGKVHYCIETVRSSTLSSTGSCSLTF